MKSLKSQEEENESHAEDRLLDLLTAYRVGRRRLLLAGGAQMLVAQLAATALMYTAFSSAAPPLYSLVLIEIIICVFTSAFCYSYGPLAWLIPTGDGPLLLLGTATHHIIRACC